MEFLNISFNKRVRSFAPCYSQSLILADFKENNNNPYKKIRETRKFRVENQTKTRVLTKNAVQEFHLWTACRYIYGLVRQEELVAFYRDAAIGLITPLRDGMNLVAKV
jgi:trehalose-6-phosphate synthase